MRIGFFAEPFGYGPASKSVAIAKSMVEQYGITPVMIGEGIAHTFMSMEIEAESVKISPHSLISDRSSLQLLGQLDAAVIALDPNWPRITKPTMPTFVVDSLGFMWDRAHFQRFPYLKGLDAYFAQDLFGAVKRLRDFGVENVVATSAIVEPTRAWTPPRSILSKYIVNMGGLRNPFQSKPPTAYLNFVFGCLKQAGLSNSNTAVIGEPIEDKGIDEKTSLPITKISKSEAAYLYANAEAVVSSPGLTTLLEVCELRQRYIPLPPQNYSQALILNKLATMHAVDPIFAFLAEAYSVGDDLSETEGVARVEVCNERFAGDADFRSRYSELFRSALLRAPPLPHDLIDGYDGASQIAKYVFEFVRTRSVVKKAAL